MSLWGSSNGWRLCLPYSIRSSGLASRSLACGRADPQRFGYFAARGIAEIAFASIGTALLVCASGANQQFLDRHFLPSFLLPRHWFVVLETFGRLAMAILGALLALVARPHAARFARERPYVRSTLLSPWSWRLSRANWSCATYTSARLNGCRPMMNLARLPDPRLGWVLGNGAHRAQDNRRARHRLLYRPSRISRQTRR
jgi:hypothetical protein